MKIIIALCLASIFLSLEASAVTVIGNAGTLGTDGIVTLPPNGELSYGWVSTSGGVYGAGLPYVVPGINGGIGNTNGSTLRSDLFSADTGDNLQFYFNYITSDGGGFADYAWARLLDNSNVEVALLFSARTKPTGSIVPGFGMPSPSATLSPVAVPIIGGAPTWSPLGISSSTCYSSGCGHTGWIQANYSILFAGNYVLEFGATNWSDTYYDSGLAFSSSTISGVPINTAIVPIPATAWLFFSGLVSLVGVARRNAA